MKKKEDIKILVVDDSSTFRTMISTFLLEYGFKSIVGAPNGKAAFTLISNQRFDLVVCDWHMPEMSGIDLVRVVKKKMPMEAPSFIMITTENKIDLVKEAIAFGVDEYLAKPFTQKQLFDKVRSVLTRKQQLSKSLTGLSLLLVDDSKSVRGLLKHMLTAMGADQVFEADDVEQALSILKQNQELDVVVCDWHMPGTNGLDFASLIREQEESKTIAFVMASSESKEEKVKQAILSEIDEYLVKPFQPSEISKKILRAVARRKKQ